jgi:outer membrane immunogenic protein
MKRLVVALSILAISAAGASAADMAVKAPAMQAEGTNWTGFYIGGNAGYAWGTATINGFENAPAPFDPADAAAISTAASLKQRANGFTGGGQAGYNWQVGAAVLGSEVDFNAFHLRGSTTGTFPFPSTLPGGSSGPPTVFFTPTSTVSTDWLFTARERIGWANDHWLLYGTGGLAVTNLNVNQSIAQVAPFVFNTPVSSTRVGWTAGAGFEYAVNRNWSVKGEYLYVDFGTVAGTGVLTPASPIAGLTYTNSTRLTANIARLGVNYHFDGPIAKY